MRDPNRIDDFTKVLNYIWKTKCPDWRFGQLVTNVFAIDAFKFWFIEEEEVLRLVCKYFQVDLEEIRKKLAEK